jgi:anti-anti-sigma factor
MSECCVTAFYVDDLRVLAIEERQVGPGQTAVAVIGDVDHSTHALLDATLLRVWEGQPAGVTVDLRLATFLNAGGLRALLLTSRTARLRGVPLVLEAGPGLVSRMLVTIGLGDLLQHDGGSGPAEPVAPLRPLQLVAPLLVDVASPGPAGEPEGPTPSRRALLRSLPSLRAADVRVGGAARSGRAQDGPLLP